MKKLTGLFLQGSSDSGEIYIFVTTFSLIKTNTWILVINKTSCVIIIKTIRVIIVDEMSINVI